MTYKTLNLNRPEVRAFYDKSLNAFSRQFKDVVTISKLYVNAQGKVFAGEWRDTRNVINFNGGYAIDAVKCIEFITK